MWKKLSLLLVLLLCLSSLAGCDLFNKDEGGQSGGPPDPPIVADNQQVGVPEGDLNFDLQPTQDPTFDGPDLSDVPDYQPDGSEPADDAMYVERDGFAYKLDPQTLEPIDVPLDPVTYQPINIEDSQIVDAEAPVVDVEVPGESQSPSRVTPTDDNKYPNTGVFLEDD